MIDFRTGRWVLVVVLVVFGLLDFGRVGRAADDVPTTPPPPLSPFYDFTLTPVWNWNDNGKTPQFAPFNFNQGAPYDVLIVCDPLTGDPNFYVFGGNGQLAQQFTEIAPGVIAGQTFKTSDPEVMLLFRHELRLRETGM